MDQFMPQSHLDPESAQSITPTLLNNDNNWDEDFGIGNGPGRCNYGVDFAEKGWGISVTESCLKSTLGKKKTSFYPI